MCRSIHAPLLLVLIVCLMNGSNFAYDPFESSLSFEPEPHVDINVLFVSFYNGMAPNNPNVNLFYNNQKDGVYLSPGKGFSKLDNLNGRKSVVMYWNGNCASFFAYDPSAEGNHQKIYWLIKEDGIYHSWDNSSWEKRKSWTFNKC